MPFLAVFEVNVADFEEFDDFLFMAARLVSSKTAGPERLTSCAISKHQRSSLTPTYHSVSLEVKSA